MEKVNERLRNLSMNDYGLSKERYRELKHFCLQYAEKKKAARACRLSAQRNHLQSGREVWTRIEAGRGRSDQARENHGKVCGGLRSYRGRGTLGSRRRRIQKRMAADSGERDGRAEL